MTSGHCHQTSGRQYRPFEGRAPLESTHDNTKRLAALRVSGVRVMSCTPRGFTLIEIMVTVAVSVILLAVAVPNYINFMRSNKLSTNVNTFVQALQFARLEARGRGATLCASTGKVGATSGHEECDSADWGKGWIVFSDYDTSGTLNGNDEILRVGEAFSADLTIMAAATLAADTAKVTFGRQGFHVPAGAEHSFEFCIGRGGKGAGRKVTVNLAGTPLVESLDTCSAT